ncbi:hypothetical protein Tco_1308326 [Tanacetum coccineum]
MIHHVLIKVTGNADSAAFRVSDRSYRNAVRSRLGSLGIAIWIAIFGVSKAHQSAYRSLLVRRTKVNWYGVPKLIADKLVFVHSNIRLISRFSESYKEGPSKKWDVNLESAYLEGSASRMEDMRWENLDED